MPLAVLLTFLSTAIVPLAKKLLAALGIGAVTYVGINFVIGQAKSYMMAQLSGVSSDVAQIMGLFKFDVAINIVVAAVTTRLVLSGVNKVTGVKKGLGSVGGD
jgi:hypothetical protein